MKRHLPLVVSLVALLVAVFGSTPVGEAARELVVPRASVGTAQLKNAAVTSAKVKDRSLLARDFKSGQLPQGPPGPQGPQGAQGPQGPPGPVTGFAGSPAGGALAGTYPDPTLRPESITSTEVADRSLTLADFASRHGQVSVDLPSIGAHSCMLVQVRIFGIGAKDRAIVSPTLNLPAGIVVMPMLDASISPTSLRMRVCNITATALNAPEGGWGYVLFR